MTSWQRRCSIGSLTQGSLCVYILLDAQCLCNVSWRAYGVKNSPKGGERLSRFIQPSHRSAPRFTLVLVLIDIAIL